MDLEEHLERLRKSCLSCNISKFLKREIFIERPGYVRISIPFNRELTQNADFLHGAIMFELADTAGFIAANSIEGKYSVLTIDYHINFIRPVKSEGLYAVGEVISSGKRIIVAQSKVYSESEKLVAFGQGSYIITNVLLKDIKSFAID